MAHRGELAEVRARFVADAERRGDVYDRLARRADDTIAALRASLDDREHTITTLQNRLGG